MKPIIVILAPEVRGFDPNAISQEIKNDYHFLVIQDPDRDKVDIQVFSSEKIEPIELDKLIELTKINIK